MKMSNLTVALRKDDARPWMGLPAARVANDATITEAMDAAGLLRWDVRKRLIVTDAITDKDDYEIIRDTDRGVHRLSISGERYETVQNEQLATMGDTITGGDVKLDVVGSYNNGRNVFLTLCLGENIVLDPEGQADEIGRYLTMRTSHDGSTAVQAIMHNMRLDCQNMLAGVKSGALSTFSMRHTQSVEGRIADARKALGIAFKQEDVFLQEMEALMAREVSDQKFWEMVQGFFPKPEADVRGSLKKWETKTDTIVGIWNGDTLSGLDKTAYRAYNALNEHLYWYTAVRAGNTENALVRASGFDENANKRNLDLYKGVLAFTS
jgi:phage/plasmid-like protein (TIGR03299 family)